MLMLVILLLLTHCQSHKTDVLYHSCTLQFSDTPTTFDTAQLLLCTLTGRAPQLQGI